MLGDALLLGLRAFLLGFSNVTPGAAVMVAVGGFLLYLAIRKDVEPLLLLPIGFGCILTNMPLSGLMQEGGVLKTLYDAGIVTELFPVLVFVGIGAMTDFGPLIERPSILLFGAAGQFGIFLTLMLALLLGFTRMESLAIGIIGACDGPTAIYVTSNYAPHLLGSVSVAAYSYMSLVPLIQPPIMRLLTTEAEKKIVMGTVKRSVSRTARILFPILATIFTALIAPMGTALMGPLMLGNLMRESGVVDRLTKASSNEIANTVTLFLGLTIGATMQAEQFLRPQTLVIFALGFVAISLDTVMGVLFGKLACLVSGGKINPLIGAAGISAFPMAARVVQSEGQRHNKKNYLLMHAMAANAGGQVGSIMAAAIMLSVVKGLGLGM